MAKLIVGDDEIELDQGSFTNKEAMEIERVSKMTFDQWALALRDGSALAITTLVYIHRRRTVNPRIQFNDIEFRLGDMKYVGDDTNEEKNDDDEGGSEVVPGGLSAELDPMDPTRAPEASTSGGSPT